ncbi:MAG TPA: DUF6114 domain-containing protein [Actinomycetes bacterium]|nr:DUF6114 domain-containing protein [Actinomycetes bacterium]
MSTEDGSSTEEEPRDGEPLRDVPERPSLRRRFRAWRRSRPFWGGLFTMLGGLEIATIPLTAYRIILVSHSVVVAAFVGVVIAILGLLLWMTPSHNKLYGLLVVLLGVVSFVTSNVGGFLLGGLLSVIGGALGFAWVVVKPAVPISDAPEREWA